MRKVYIAPSLLAMDKNDYKGEIDKILKLGVTYIHFDVMDEEFIGHTSFSFDDFKRVKKLHNVINDVHIMVATPYEYSKEYSKLGAQLVTFHYEAVKDDVSVFDLIEAMRKMNIKVGISIKPKTDVKKILPYLHLVDLVLIMSVEPGKGGQSFMPNSLDKIKACREYIDSNKLNCLVEVDGGINDITGVACYKAGADILVAGSYLFGHDDIKDRYNRLLKGCKYE